MAVGRNLGGETRCGQHFDLIRSRTVQFGRPGSTPGRQGRREPRTTCSGPMTRNCVPRTAPLAVQAAPRRRARPERCSRSSTCARYATGARTDPRPRLPLLGRLPLACIAENADGQKWRERPSSLSIPTWVPIRQGGRFAESHHCSSGKVGALATRPAAAGTAGDERGRSLIISRS